MNLRVTLGILAALAISALGIFYLFQRELSGAWFAFGVHPDVLRRLDSSLADQKRLAHLDPARAEAYRKSFDSTEALLARLRVLEYNRDDIARRYGYALTAVFAGVLGLAGTAYVVRSPLTAAQLELARLRDLAGSDEACRSIDSVEAELERLGRFARDFTAFARVSRPARKREDLAALIGEFVRLFDGAWPNLRLAWQPPAESVPVDLDREMLRQVLVNLCENSSRALDERPGTQRLALLPSAESVVLEVADDGPGVAPEIAARLFEPYATTRRVGEGMGLGLAISRKILLDHGGDLELASTSGEGSTFRLVFPRAT